MGTKSIYVLAAFLLLFAACREEEEYNSDTATIVIGKNKYEVGAEGGKLTVELTHTFWYGGCVRYTALDTVEFTLSAFPQEEAYWSDDTLSYENVTLWGEERRLNIEVGPNDLTLDKEFYFKIRNKNRFEGIRILQKGRKE